MKSKRFLCTVLACVVMISCITNAAAIQEEVADDFVEYNTESILTTRATIVSKSPEIGVGASYETPVIDKDYAKYTVSIMAASTDGTYSIRYHD